MVKFILQVIKIFIIEQIFINRDSGSCSSTCTCSFSELLIRGVVEAIVHNAIGIKLDLMNL